VWNGQSDRKSWASGFPNAIDNAIANATLPRPFALPQTRFSGADDRLCSVSNLKLGEDVGDVVAHRLTARFTVVDPQGGIRHARRSPGRLGYLSPIAPHLSPPLMPLCPWHTPHVGGA
jgi:hypothetical protein